MDFPDEIIYLSGNGVALAFQDKIDPKYLHFVRQDPDIDFEEVIFSPDPKYSVIALFYLINSIFKTPKKFKLDHSAIVEYVKLNQDYKKMVRVVNNIDNFIGAMLGKCNTHLLRLCGI
ncbi:MAG: hypothetical protein ACKO96_11305, partial [Flammeovirgaceae bacterium]